MLAALDAQQSWITAFSLLRAGWWYRVRAPSFHARVQGRSTPQVDPETLAGAHWQSRSWQVFLRIKATICPSPNSYGLAALFAQSAPPSWMVLVHPRRGRGEL